jgi:hypothetical protein
MYAVVDIAARERQNNINGRRVTVPLAAGPFTRYEEAKKHAKREDRAVVPV